MSDADLLVAVGAGDQDALVRLRDRYQAQLWDRVFSVVRSPAMTDEVLQELWLFVWTEASRFDPARGRVAAWLTTIAQRRAVDVVRSAEASRRRDARWLLLDRPTSFDVAAERAEIVWVRRRLGAALERLTPNQRTVIELQFFGHLGSPEIASRLGIPVGTSRTRLRDALIRLRTLLADIGDPPPVAEEDRAATAPPPRLAAGSVPRAEAAAGADRRTDGVGDLDGCVAS